MRVSTARGILAGVALLLTASSALAVDATALGNRMKEALAGSSIAMTFASAEEQGSNVVLKDVAIGPAGDTAPIGDVTLENVSGSDAEGWKIARIPFADIDKTNEGKQAIITGMSIDGVLIAAKSGESTLPGKANFFFDSAGLDSATVKNAGQTVFTLGETSFSNTVSPGDGAINSAFTLGDFSLDVAATGDPSFVNVMQALGYSTLKGSGGFEGSWNPTSGETTLDPFRLSVADAGELFFSYSIDGYTPAFAKSLADVQKQMAANPADSQASGMAILGLMSQLSLGSMELSYTDASLAGKLLDYFAKQNGTTREDLVASLSQMAPQALAALDNPQFQNEVGTAVSTFLKDPQSLSISINPDKPIPATEIMGAAMGARQTLPNVLQLKVTANEATDAGDDDAPADGTDAPADGTNPQ